MSILYKEKVFLHFRFGPNITLYSIKMLPYSFFSSGPFSFSSISILLASTVK